MKANLRSLLAIALVVGFILAGAGNKISGMCALLARGQVTYLSDYTDYVSRYVYKISALRPELSQVRAACFLACPADGKDQAADRLVLAQYSLSPILLKRGVDGDCAATISCVYPEGAPDGDVIPDFMLIKPDFE